jgi:hypothetical protein
MSYTYNPFHIKQRADDLECGYLQFYKAGRFIALIDEFQSYVDRLYDLNGVLLYDLSKVLPPDPVKKITSIEIQRPATSSELKAAGLWDMVINKDDYSSEEDELEEYLRIAEEKK